MSPSPISIQPLSTPKTLSPSDSLINLLEFQVRDHTRPTTEYSQRHQASSLKDTPKTHPQRYIDYKGSPGRVQVRSQKALAPKSDWPSVPWA
ncbi:hypothetical protein QCA50_020225 [Cerrena zonata]|uniref:Uncharacterized protein n=1 Tax=Cerrena zonata TaxID=2478898 RepID=A0AAW0FDM9_9APHY